MIFLRLESSDYLQMQAEQEKLKKDKEKLEIAFKGIKAVTTCCTKHLSEIQEMLLITKPKVFFLYFSTFILISFLFFYLK